MNRDLFWIPSTGPGRLAIALRPRGGDWLDDQARAWCRAGVDVVVSLLEPEEEAQLNLAGERDAAERNGIQFISFPVVDRGVPSSIHETVPLLKTIANALENGKNVALHCRQGIGRSGMIAAAVLMSTGSTPDLAIDAVTSARGLTVPETPEQVRWLQESVTKINGAALRAIAQP